MYKIKTVMILHTGGRNYLLCGELENGLYFSYGMDNITFYDENYEKSLSYNGFLWEKKHKIKQLITTKDILEFEQNLKEKLEEVYGNIAMIDFV